LHSIDDEAVLNKWKSNLEEFRLDGWPAQWQKLMGDLNVIPRKKSN
jgi:hypothetical protein